MGNAKATVSSTVQFSDPDGHPHSFLPILVRTNYRGVDREFVLTLDADGAATIETVEGATLEVCLLDPPPMTAQVVGVEAYYGPN